jgi:hypothetical protein
VLIGDKQRFAAEVGEFWDETRICRRVDLWAAGHWLTCDDNSVHVGVFTTSVRSTLRWLQSGRDLTPPFPGVSMEETHRRLLEIDDGSREQFWFPRWGPETDNVTGHLFRIGDQLAITFEFWREQHPNAEERGQVFVARLPESEFVRVLEQLVSALG